MTKSELIEALARKFPQLPHADVDLSTRLILDAISDQLKQGDRAEIRGFGTFHVNCRPPRLGRNPRTGEAVQVPGKSVPHFKPGKEMRERVLESATRKGK